MCGPTIINTDAALAQQVDVLQGVYSVQDEALQTALTFDCTDFAQKKVCVTGGAHYGTANSSTDAYSALLAGAYKVNQNLSVGAYLNQVVASKQGTGADERFKSPLVAVFSDWSENNGSAGLKTHVAGGYSQTDLTLTRSVFGVPGFGNPQSEPGVGSTTLDTYGVSGRVTYGVPLNNGFLATPYAGVEYTNISRKGYTETTAVSAPLTFDTLNDRATTVSGGVSVDKKINERVSLTGSAGLEYDLARNAGTDLARGTLGNGTAASAAFGADEHRLRFNAGLGGSFAIQPGQSVVAGVNWRQESFRSSNAFGVTAAYRVGF